MSRITVVRHGNTFAPGEAPRRIGARTDLPLVASGIAQARAIGRAFAAHDRRFARILCAPLRRTRETAALIRDGLGSDAPPLEPCDWLAEIDHGPDEGASEAEVVARIGPDALAAWDAHGVPPPGWLVDGDARIAAWQGFFAEMRIVDGDALLVTSNGAARFARLADPVLAQAAAPLKLRTGALGTITLSPGATRLDDWDVRP